MKKLIYPLLITIGVLFIILFLLGIKWSFCIFGGIIALISITVISHLMVKKGKGKRAYDLFGGIGAWFALQLVIYFFFPVMFKVLSIRPELWTLNILIFIGLSLLGFTNFSILSIRFVFFFILFLTLGIMFSRFTETGSGYRTSMENKLMGATIKDAIISVETAENHSQALRKLENLLTLEEKAKKGPLSIQEKQDLSNLENWQKEKYPDEKKDMQKEVKRVLSGVFEVPVGKDKIFYTGLFSLPNDSIFFEVIGKNPVLLRNGLDKKIKIYPTLSLKANDEGEIQFWWGPNPAKIKINIKPSN